MNVLILGIFIVSIVLIIVAFFYNVQTYKQYYAIFGISSLFGSLFLALWVFLDFLTFLFSQAEWYLPQIADLSGSFLAVGFFSLHYFYDEMSTSYRQRRSIAMNLAITGFLLGTIWIEGVNHVTSEGLIATNRYVTALYILQGALLISRIFLHIEKQDSLAEYYGLSRILSQKNFKVLRTFLIFVLLSSLGMLVFLPETLSLPFIPLTALALFALALLTSNRNLMAFPISQKVRALAIVKGNEVVYSYRFATHKIDEQNFITFMLELNKLMQELIRTESRLMSINTRDMLVMFDNVKEHVVLLLAERQSPLLSKTFRYVIQQLRLIGLETHQAIDELVERSFLSLKEIISIE